MECLQYIIVVCSMAGILYKHELQKKTCYFDNYVSHQNSNSWHSFMGWYYNSPLWQPAMGNTVHME